MEIQTERLYIREMTMSDYAALCTILQDKEVMYAYEHAFCDEEVKQWLDNQQRRYQEDGYGLWSVLLKETNQMIGQCGLTKQVVRNQNVMEVGYLFQKQFWHQGFATEASQACIQYAFQNYPVDEVYSIIRDSNHASKKVATKNHMVLCDHMIKQYYQMEMPHDVYKITRAMYESKSKND